MAAHPRTRSPRAPRHSLPEALALTAKIYAAAHTSQIDSITAYKLMGFAGKSGSSATALGSARQFGLIEGIGDKTRVSELSLKIFEPASADERYEALCQAAREPEVFRLIYERFEGRVPSSDEPIRAYLIRELSFSPSGAEDCIKAFRATNSELEHTRQPKLQELAVAEPPARSSRPEHVREQDEAGDYIRLPLTRDCSVELRFFGRISQRAIANLVSHIELMEDVWSEA